MLYHLNGKISELSTDNAIIDCNGVGYYISITPNTAASLTIGEMSKLYVAESIGEDHYDLYGFMSLRERQFYYLLIGVSGIGPKAAMSILSYNDPSSLTMAILNSNESSLTNCPGIGKKTAQRIILELKDKIAKQSENSEFISSVTSIPQTHLTSNAYDEAITALGVLGYNSNDVIKILRQIDTNDLSTEQIIKSVLKYMV